MESYIKEALNSFIEKRPELITIVRALRARGALVYLVGGAVRDMVLARPIHDVDIEVHGVDIEQLENVLSMFGVVRFVGKQFGVLRIDGVDVDWSLPRSDSAGRHPNVVIDSSMSIEESSTRRDVTINAMALRLDTVVMIDELVNSEHITDELFIDPHGGVRDCKRGMLRLVSPERFSEDPLRFYRVMHFVARFEMEPDEELKAVCSSMDLTGVARERIWYEVKKMLMLSSRPSLGFRFVHSIGRLSETFPEVYALVGTEQIAVHHPESDVFEHSMQALDAVAVCGHEFDGHEALLLLLGVLCHDFGKPVTTCGEGRSIGHEKHGADIAYTFVKRLSGSRDLAESVRKIVLHHRAPECFVDQGAKERAYKRLAIACAPHVSLQLLAYVALCDRRGRNPKGSMPLTYGGEEMLSIFLQKAAEVQVDAQPEPPLLLGRDLLDTISAGPRLGRLVKRAYEIQIEQSIHDKNELKRLVLEDEATRK